MKRCTAFDVLRVYVKLFFMEVQNSINFISLGCEMEHRHAQVASDVEIGFILEQAFENCDITLECRIVCSSIPLDILGIEKQTCVASDFRQGKALIFEGFSIIFDVEFDVFVLIEEGAVMNRCVFLIIADDHEIYGGFFVIKEELDVL